MRDAESPNRSHAPDGRWPWNPVLLIALAGLLIRLAFGLFYWTDQPLTRDEQEYLSLARSLSAGRGFVYDDTLRNDIDAPFGRAPGYPAFLALVGGGRAPATHTPVTVQIAQAVVGAIGIVLAAAWAYRLGRARAAIATAAIAAVYPPLVWVAGYALSEALFWPLSLLAAWLFDRSISHHGRTGHAFWCGVTTGIAILVRPAFLLFLPLAMLLLAARRGRRALAGIMAGAVLLLGPWAARNYQHHGQFVLVAPQGGVNFWIGNHSLAVGDGDMAANPAIKLDHQRLRADHAGLSEVQMEPIYYREALTWLRANPVDWIALELRKLFYLIVPIGPSYTLHSTRYYALSVLSFSALLALALVAIVRGGTRVATPGLRLLVGSAIAVALVFFPHERFRLATFDPALVVLAGCAVAAARRRPGDAP